MIELNLRQLNEGEGAPIVLVHGFMGSSLDWETLVAEEKFPDRPTFAIDLPGHGESMELEGEWGFAELNELLREALPGEPFDLVGYSMGGRVSLYFAGTNPKRVRSLILIGANPGIEHPKDRNNRAHLDGARAGLLIERPDIFVEEWAALEMFGPRTTSGWEGVASRRADTALGHGWGWARALTCLTVGRQLLLWNVPYMTETRTLFIAGTHDEKYIEVGKELRAQNPGHVELQLIVGAHHAPHLDRPDLVAKRLREFLALQ